MAKVLVTGGAGFIGSHTVDALLARGHEVRVLDLLLPPVHDGTVPEYLSRDAEFVRGDVRDRATMQKALEGIEIVYHLAAYQDYLPDFSTFFSTNSTSTALLYELIVANATKVELVVVASSQAVYGEGRYDDRGRAVFPGPRPEAQLVKAQWEHRSEDGKRQLTHQWTDESVMLPHNSYGLSKRDQDDIAMHLGRRYNIPSVAFRYSIVQGPRQSFRNAYSGALRAFTVQLGSKVAPLVYEDGQQIRDYVSYRDVVRANLLPLDDPTMAYHSFNVGGNRAVTVLELAALVAKVIGVDLAPSIPGFYRVGDTRHIKSDVSRLQKHGWDVSISLEDVVREYATWALNSPGFFNAATDALKRMEQLGVLKRIR